MRPDVGTQPQFRKKKPPATYRYDSSLSPALNWDGQNPARELGEWLLGLIQRAATSSAHHAFDRPQEFKTADGTVLATVTTLHEAVDLLGRLGRPFLDWAGKAERRSFDVPTLPVFIHERWVAAVNADGAYGPLAVRDREADRGHPAAAERRCQHQVRRADCHGHGIAAIHPADG
jgi:hypothetical protein